MTTPLHNFDDGNPIGHPSYTSPPQGNMITVAEKLKPSIVPVAKLQIGSWIRKSAFLGDIFCKFYYKKRQIVWEMMGEPMGYLRKIVINFFEVQSIHFNIKQDQPASMTVKITRQPNFFQEVNPQPGKNVQWAPAQDFTNGQAMISSNHVVYFSKNALTKHLAKLMSDDMLRKVIVASTIPEYISLTHPATHGHDEEDDDDEEEQTAPYQQPYQAPYNPNYQYQEQYSQYPQVQYPIRYQPYQQVYQPYPPYQNFSPSKQPSPSQQPIQFQQIPQYPHIPYGYPQHNYAPYNANPNVSTEFTAQYYNQPITVETDSRRKSTETVSSTQDGHVSVAGFDSQASETQLGLAETNP